MRNRYDENNQTLLMKFFKIFSIYLFISFIVFFAYIKFIGKVEPVIIDIPIGIGKADNEPNEMSAFLENIMTIKDADMDLGVNLDSQKASLKMGGNVKFNIKNTEDIKLEGDVNLEINETNYHVVFKYTNQNFYLNLNDGYYKIPLENLDPKNLSKVTEIVSGLIPEEGTSDLLTKLQDIVGVDFSDVGALLGFLSSEFELVDDVYNFDLSFGKLRAKGQTDAELKLKSLVVDPITIDGYTISLNTNVNSLNQDLDVKIEETEEQKYLDVNRLVELFKKGKLDLGLNLKLNNKEYKVNLKVDYSDKENIKIDIPNVNIMGYNLSVRFEDNQIFINYADKKITEKVENIGQIYEKIDVLLQKFGINLEIDQKLNDVNKDIDFKEMLEKVDYKISLKDFGFVLNVKDYDNLSTKYEYENLLNLSIKQNQDLSLNLDATIMDSYNLNINLSETVEEIVPYSDEEKATYTNTFESVVDIADKAIQIYENIKTDYGYAFSANLGVRYSTTTFEGNIIALLYEENGVITPYVYLYTTSLGLDTYIYYVQEYILVDIQGLKIKVIPTKDNINYLLNWINQRFELNLDIEGTSSALSVVIPTLQEVYLNFTSNYLSFGLDMLPYMQNENQITAYFEDLLVEICLGENYLSKIILGADIIDPNTTKKYDSYEEFKLSYEDSQTITKNFAMYITDIATGNFVEQKDLFEIFDGQLVAVKTGELTEFNDFTLFTNLVDYVYDYILDAKMNLNANVSMFNNGTKTLEVKGDISALVDYSNDLIIKSAGRNIVLSDLTSNVSHALAYLYDNDSAYFSYNHGEAINGNAFKGKLHKTSLQNIFGIIVSIFDIDLQEIGSTLDIVPSNSDFTFIKQLLGLEGKLDVTDEVDYIDNLLSDVQNILSMVESINYSYRYTNSVKIDRFVIKIKLFDKLATISLTADGTKIRTIDVSNLAISDNDVINLKLTFNNFDDNVFNQYDKSNHTDLSSITHLLESGINTLNTKEFHYAGKMTVNFVININADVTIYAYFDKDNKIVLDVTLAHSVAIIGVTYGSGNQYTSSSLFSNRVSNIHYQNGYIYVTQKNDGKILNKNSGIENVSFVHKLSELKTIDDFFKIFSEAIGFTDSLHTSIVESIKANNPDTKLESIFKKYESNYSNNNYNYDITLNGTKLVGNENIGDMKFNLGENNTISSYNNTYSYLNTIGMEMGIKVIGSSELKLNLNLSATNDYVNLIRNYYKNK